MAAPYNTFQFDWLMSPDVRNEVLYPEQGDVEWLRFPMDPSLGEGGFQKIELALNMSVFRGVHRFKPAAVGQLIPLAKVNVDFPGKTLMVQILRGGRILHRESHPRCEVLFSPGLDLFRLTDRLEVTPILDGSQSSEMTCLTVGMQALGDLIGHDLAEQLLQALTLSTCPAVVVRAIPLYVSAHLHGAIDHRLTGTIRRLNCQARVLDYLSALVDNLCLKAANPSARRGTHSLAQDVHQFLIRSEGKLPTLDALARQFCLPAKRLNEEFIAEYGKSINAFITEHRLDEAHAAIQHSSISLKKLAERFGYAHFNHFSAAFKRKFGYPPGSLRRKPKVDESA